MAYGGGLLSTSQEVTSHASHSWNMRVGLTALKLCRPRYSTAKTRQYVKELSLSFL